MCDAESVDALINDTSNSDWRLRLRSVCALIDVVARFAECADDADVAGADNICIRGLNKTSSDAAITAIVARFTDNNGTVAAGVLRHMSSPAPERRDGALSIIIHYDNRALSAFVAAITHNLASTNAALKQISVRLMLSAIDYVRPPTALIPPFAASAMTANGKVKVQIVDALTNMIVTMTRRRIIDLSSAQSAVIAHSWIKYAIPLAFSVGDETAFAVKKSLTALLLTLFDLLGIALFDSITLAALRINANNINQVKTLLKSIQTKPTT